MGGAPARAGGYLRPLEGRRPAEYVRIPPLPARTPLGPLRIPPLLPLVERRGFRDARCLLMRILRAMVPS